MSDELLSRVQRLERYNRFLIGFVALVCAGIGILFLSGASKGIPETLVAHSLQIIGPDGKNAILLGASSDGWTSMAFRGLDGRLNTVLVVTPSGKSTLSMSDGKTTRLSAGVVGRTDEFSMQIRDASGKLVWQPDVKNAH